MDWFWFALAAPALFALSSQMDKFLMHHKTTEHTNVIARLTLYSSFIGVLFLPLLLVFGVEPFAGISLFQIGVMIFSGMLGMLYLWLYFFALEKADVSVVSPIFQLVPAFELVLAYLFLHEALTLKQLVGFSIILCGALIITLNTEELKQRKFRIHKRVIGFMVLSSLCYALTAVIYKWVVVDSVFLNVLFWEYCGAILFGGLFVLFGTVYRREALSILRSRNYHLLSFNVLNEFITIGATLSMRYAFIFAPIALVSVVSSVQPVFTLVFGALFTWFAPQIIRETVSWQHVTQKAIAIGIMIFGTIVIYL